jgi:ABC-type glycerol-3-phosphate transport system substrate-binding protein
MPVRKLVTRLLALAVAGTAVACSSGSSGGSGGSTTLKIITWVNPPALKALARPVRLRC